MCTERKILVVMIVNNADIVVRVGVSIFVKCILISPIIVSVGVKIIRHFQFPMLGERLNIRESRSRIPTFITHFLQGALVNLVHRRIRVIGVAVLAIYDTIVVTRCSGVVVIEIHEKISSVFTESPVVQTANPVTRYIRMGRQALIILILQDPIRPKKLTERRRGHPVIIESKLRGDFHIIFIADIPLYIRLESVTCCNIIGIRSVGFFLYPSIEGVLINSFGQRFIIISSEGIASVYF